ncbi:MAG: error-prone DNA polymerase [Alphaproteobacteria bacterium]|nr:error-prone DNA polymerase [Alphaproteobacteria bacterium]
MAGGPLAYAELQATSNFSFLEGASHPEELVTEAAALGLSAIAVTDRNSLAGVVRAHLATRDLPIRLVIGARLDLRDAPAILAYPQDRTAYEDLSQTITLGRRRVEKGEFDLWLSDLADRVAGWQIVIVPPADPARMDRNFVDDVRRISALGPSGCHLALTRYQDGEDERRTARLRAVSSETGVALAVTGDVRQHVPERRPLADVLACIREGTTLERAGTRLSLNADRHVKPPQEMLRLHADLPEAVTAGARIAGACRFSLDDLRYSYPDEATEEGRSADEELAYRAWQGAERRYPDGVPMGVKAQVEHELGLIAELGYAPYFLTVWDIVRFARSRNILCQGRGSAANSAVCYCLGVTAVDPAHTELLFERFVSAARNEPPDIDVDFEHERREEVIQYIYEKYGRDRAGLAATVISYRRRSAIRDVGKAMGLSEDAVSALATTIWGMHGEGLTAEQIREVGLDPEERTLRLTLRLVEELIGFPRHLSQHVGGFVMTKGRLDALVPIENAAMPHRTVIQWDKDDLDALGILKVDVLALGMLTCVRKAFDLLAQHHGKPMALADVPAEDTEVYDMLCRGDSLGVFQVESRAQMAMLPRLKPRDFYDLVVEVAIVRPGPIQGDMVHPYLRRRTGEEKVSFPSPELERVLGKTLGVPLFQEQAMKIAIVAAGFTPTEADQLRRALATFKKTGTISTFHDKMIRGMVANGYDRDFAERCFRQIEGFGNYGFPESHAASFALLVYVSSWLKCHYPEVFACALLNAQPMGFYAPAQIVRDAREHGVEVRPPDVNHSFWDNSLEPISNPEPGRPAFALRLGLRQIKGVSEAAADRLVAARKGGYPEPRALWRRAGLTPAEMEILARGDAFGSLGLDRRRALWAVRALGDTPLPLFAASGAEVVGAEPAVVLPEMAPGEQVVEDYASLRLTLRAHPLALLRAHLTAQGWSDSRTLRDSVNGQRVRLPGLALVRQRPGTAKGIIFITMEDEHGVANLVVRPPVFERFRKTVLTAKMLGVVGHVEREGIVIHVIVRELVDLTGDLGALSEGGFDGVLARADEVRRPTIDQRKDRPALQLSSRDFH